MENEVKIDNQSNNKSKEQERKGLGNGVEALAEITSALEVVGEKIDKALQSLSSPCVAILGLLITSFYEKSQGKVNTILMRDPDFRRVKDGIDAKRAQKKDE